MLPENAFFPVPGFCDKRIQLLYVAGTRGNVYLNKKMEFLDNLTLLSFEDKPCLGY